MKLFQSTERDLMMLLQKGSNFYISIWSNMHIFRITFQPIFNNGVYNENGYPLRYTKQLSF